MVQKVLAGDASLDDALADAKRALEDIVEGQVSIEGAVKAPPLELNSPPRVLGRRPGISARDILRNCGESRSGHVYLRIPPRNTARGRASLHEIQSCSQSRQAWVSCPDLIDTSAISEADACVSLLRLGGAPVPFTNSDCRCSFSSVSLPGRQPG